MLDVWMVCKGSVDGDRIDVGKASVQLSFFFQAEDGIRDLVRSRGLGDVYKRQGNLDGSTGSSIIDLLFERRAALERPC